MSRAPDVAPPSDVLAACGLYTLGTDPPPEAVDAVLRRLAERMDGADPTRRAVLRSGAVQAIEDAGVPDAARLVDAALGIEPMTAPASRPAIVRLADMEPEEVTWLWEPYIARRKLTLLEGDPAAGKTWVALSIAAILSRAGHWPIGGRAEIGRTLYLTAEDGLADTIRPRVDDLGGNPANIYALTGIIRVNPETGEEVEQGGITITDTATIEAALEQVRPALVVIDPIQGFLGAKVDMHRANEVRPLLAQLARWAERFDCAVLVLRHLAKSRASKAAYQGLGSIDFTAAARSVLLAGADPESGERSLVHLKSSLAPAGQSLGYELRQGYGLVWTGASEATAASLLAPEPIQRAESDESRSKLDEAMGWLEGELAAGPVPVSDLQKYARRDGFGWRTVESAKAKLGVRSKREGATWVWIMSAHTAQTAALRPCGVGEVITRTEDSQDRKTARPQESMDDCGDDEEGLPFTNAPEPVTMTAVAPGRAADVEGMDL